MVSGSIYTGNEIMNKFLISEIITDFNNHNLSGVSEKDILKYINESSSTGIARGGDVDDGRLGPWYPGYSAYLKGVRDKAELNGLKIINHMVQNDKDVGDEYAKFMGYIFPAGDQANKLDKKTSSTAESDPKDGAGSSKGKYQNTKKHYEIFRQIMSDMATRLGFEILQWTDESPWNIGTLKSKDIKNISPKNINEHISIQEDNDKYILELYRLLIKK